MKKEFIEIRYNDMSKRLGYLADEMLNVASRLVSISSYCSRKMDGKSAEYVNLWVYEVMDTLDYMYRSQISEIEAFQQIYNAEYDYEKDICLDGIKDLCREFERAISTYGEMKLSIRPAKGLPSYDRTEEIEHNLKELEYED